MFLSDLSIRRPVFATMMIVALLLFGIISRQRIGVALYPEVDFPSASISTTLRGASPEVIRKHYEAMNLQANADRVMQKLFDADRETGKFPTVCSAECAQG